MKAIGTILLLLVTTLMIPLEHSYAQTTVSLPPTNLSASAVTDSQINLNWAAPINSTLNEVNGYKIDRDAGCVGSFSVHVANISATTFADTNLLDGFCYAYKVYALNPVGASSPSDIANATTLSTPSAVTGLSVTPLSSSSLKLSWNVPDYNGGSQITGYQIQRNGTTLVSNTANNQTTYIDANLLMKHQQTYRVAAWNSIGLGSFSANVTANTLNQTSTTNSTVKDNLGQAIADFVHKRNDFFKKQRDETLKIIKECHDKSLNANATQRKQVKDECKTLLHDLKEKYKDVRQQFKEEFKQFRETTKSTLNIAKKDDLIDKGDLKEIQKEIKAFDNDTKKEEKQINHDIKDLKKEQKKQDKELKKEHEKKGKD